MKYVIIENRSPILFGIEIVHKDMAHRYNITSAGFCFISFNQNECKYKVKAYGESTSLGIKSKENDNKIIENILNEY